jgi:DNA polymerase-3 subunit delta'
VIILIADDLGPISATIRSRCQLVPFRRLSERAVREVVDARGPDASAERRIALARVAGGRLDRLERLLDPGSAARRDKLVEVARSVYRDPAFDSTAAAEVLLDCARERAEHARAVEEARLEQLDLPEKEAEQRIKRAQRGAERDELLAQLEELAGWYRDLVVVGVGAESAAMHLDRIEELKADTSRERLVGAENAAEIVRAAWRRLEEFNLSSQLALEALWIRLHRELAS